VGTNDLYFLKFLLNPYGTRTVYHVDTAQVAFLLCFPHLNYQYDRKNAYLHYSSLLARSAR
jgi:hypothetical protein